VLIAIAVVIALKIKKPQVAIAPEPQIPTAPERDSPGDRDRGERRPRRYPKPQERNQTAPRPIPGFVPPRTDEPTQPPVHTPAPQPQREATPNDDLPPDEPTPEAPEPEAFPIDGNFGRIILPSGEELSDELASISADAIREVFKDESLQKTTNVNAAGRVEGILCYDNQGYLHGPQVIFLDDNRPRAFGFYEHAKREGMLRLWDTQGRRRLIAFYRNGKNDGLYVHFSEDVPRWIDEYNLGKRTASHLVVYEQQKPRLISFASHEEAMSDDRAASEIELVIALEEEMNQGERKLRKALNDWHGKMVEAERRALRAATAPARRELTRQRDQIYSDMQRQADAALDGLINFSHERVRRQFGS
jgi:antitoxin component YwqK of YwqJK toxin-antitoxin module